MIHPSDPYWDSADRPDRDRLLNGVALYAPFTSILDIGCNSGPVRKRLRQRFGPTFTYVGFDVNEQALELAKHHAVIDGDTQASFMLVDIRTGLAARPDASVDVVVSSSVLQVLEFDDWFRTLVHLRRMAVKGVVVLEDYGFGEQCSGRGFAYTYPSWVVTC